jgi:glucose-1-phosphate cytidylyltransferase
VKTAILAGGMGTRMREETEFRPKPMVTIGDRPIIWHILNNYSYFGFKEFVVCAGYRGDLIKRYFREFESEVSDFTVTLGRKSEITYHDSFQEEGWRVTVSDTGLDTPTGGRLFKARKYLTDDVFMCTYGDGLADVDLKSLLDFHLSHGKIATVTAVRPISRFGVLDLSFNGQVDSFREKPQADGWINVGFFVFNRKIFEYLDDKSVLENEPLASLAKDNQLMGFRHKGFWQPMDTFREYTIFNDMWKSGHPPWILK